MKLFCKLTSSVITKDGDFVPRGSIVQVLSWMPTNDGSKRVMCLTTVHMYASDIIDTLYPEWEGNINRGLYIDVKYTDLEYWSKNNN